MILTFVGPFLVIGYVIGYLTAAHRIAQWFHDDEPRLSDDHVMQMLNVLLGLLLALFWPVMALCLGLSRLWFPISTRQPSR